MDRSLVQTIVFDLDDTLIDTTARLIPVATRDAASAMVAAGWPGQVQDILSIRQQLLASGSSRDFIDQATIGIQDQQLREKIRLAGHTEFYVSGPERLNLLKGSRHIGEARELLAQLRSHFRLVLLTAGDRTTQLLKVHLSGLGEYFVSIETTEQPQAKGKAFEQMVSGKNGRAFLSIGNRLDTDIAAAKICGMQTIWFRFGEYNHMSPSEWIGSADVTVHSISELREVLLGGI